MMQSNYDKQPYVAVPNGAGACVTGWQAVTDRLSKAVAARSMKRTVVTIECYTGVNEAEIAEALKVLSPARVVCSSDAFLAPEVLDAKVATFNGGDDPVFGIMNHLRMEDFMDAGKVASLASEIEQVESGLVIVIGCGASLIHPGDLLVYADSGTLGGPVAYASR